MIKILLYHKKEVLHFFSSARIKGNLEEKIFPQQTGKFLEMGIPEHFTCLLQNLYEVTVRNGHGAADWFQIEKGVYQVAYCHPIYLTYIQSTS